jgi:hypothetical protein
VRNGWCHPAYPRHVLWKPADHVVVVTQLALSTPKEAEVLQLGGIALGPAATPSHIASYPLALRLPMRSPDTPPFALPDGNFRVRRLWPPAGQPAHVEYVDKVPVEVRVSGTSVGQGLRLYAEAFIGRVHQNREKQPRSLIYTGDARHVLLAPDQMRVRRFTARIMDALLMFAHRRQDEGLTVDHRPLSGRRIGRVRMSAADVGDVEFAIRLPQPGRTESYVGSYVLP